MYDLRDVFRDYGGRMDMNSEVAWDSFEKEMVQRFPGSASSGWSALTSNLFRIKSCTVPAEFSTNVSFNLDVAIAGGLNLRPT